ncbi:MAG: hypothetical protein VYD25_13750 [Pseudomonadota bacterium]|nr:hypothetical protein [Pseudomonadota bacterium]MEE3288586.1 hypothetical protein [Pseudomonadota bacterium]
MADQEKTELIAELKKLGKLLDPDLEADEDPSRSATATTSLESIPAELSPEPPAGPSSLQTVDMFDSETATPSNQPLPALSPLNTETVPDGPQSTVMDDQLDPVLEEQQEEPSTPEGKTPQLTGHDPELNPDTIDELSGELVNIIEKTLSHRSGESLDESLRDKLHAKVGNHLKNWLIKD